MANNRLFKAILRNQWIIIFLTIIGACLGEFVNTYLIVPVYRAETTVYALNRDKAINYQDMMMNRLLVQDYSEIIYSKKVASLAMEELRGMNLDEDTIRRMIHINLTKESSVMRIQAFSSDAVTAAAVANAMSRAFTEQVRAMTNSDIVGILDEAVVPEEPVPVNKTKNIVIGMLAGMTIGFVIIYIRELFDMTIRSVDEVEYNLNLPVVGIIPQHNI